MVKNVFASYFLEFAALKHYQKLHYSMHFKLTGEGLLPLHVPHTPCSPHVCLRLPHRDGKNALLYLPTQLKSRRNVFRTFLKLKITCM